MHFASADQVDVFHTISYNLSLHFLSSIIINGKYGDSPGLYTSVINLTVTSGELLSLYIAVDYLQLYM